MRGSPRSNSRKLPVPVSDDQLRLEAGDAGCQQDRPQGGLQRRRGSGVVPRQHPTCPGRAGAAQCLYLGSYLVDPYHAKGDRLLEDGEAMRGSRVAETVDHGTERARVATLAVVIREGPVPEGDIVRNVPALAVCRHRHIPPDWTRCDAQIPVPCGSEVGNRTA